MFASVRVAASRQLKRFNSNLPRIDRSKFPVLNENELDEKFIYGWGPGGQNVNKSTNCCQLKHIPTGIIVKVHQYRKLEQNRKVAREILAARVDNLINGDDSVEAQKKRIALYKLSIKESAAEKKRQMKKEYLEEFRKVGPENET